MRCAILALCLITAALPAQERVPDEEAKKITKLLLEAAAKVKPPFKLEVDADKPSASSTP
jgi:hypothetical protein